MRYARVSVAGLMLLLAMPSCVGSTAQESSGAREQVFQVQGQRLKALVEQDIETLESLIADELIYIHSTGAVDRKASYLTFVRAQNYLSFEPEDMEASVHGDVAVVTGRLRMTLIPYRQTEQLGLHLRVTEVYLNRDDRWLFAYSQATTMGDQTVPAPRPVSDEG